MGDFTAQFKELAKKNIDDQTKFFLTQFVLDFCGQFDEVLDIAEAFRKYVPKDQAKTAGSVDELQAHLFLEKRDETLTVKELRDYLKQVHLGNHHPVAITEYLLWKYKKTAKELFEPVKGVDPALIAALEKAIDQYKEALAIKQAREEKMRELERVAALGGVKGMTAKNQLEQMRSEDQLELNRREISSAAAKRRAQKAVDQDDGSAARERALKEEQERLERERQQKDEEERKTKEDSRNRLKARAQMWQ